MPTESISVVLPIERKLAAELMRLPLSKNWPDDSAESMANYEFRSTIICTIMLEQRFVSRNLCDERGYWTNKPAEATHVCYQYSFDYI